MGRTKDDIVTTFATDADGIALAFVTLARGEIATLWRATYDWLVGNGVSLAWCLNGPSPHRYVAAPNYRASGCRVTIARVIAGAGRGQRVRYSDGDRLNLRCGNLVIELGFARRRDGAIPTILGKPERMPAIAA